MSFTLSQVLTASRRKDVVIAVDTAGYLALAVAEQLFDGRAFEPATSCLEESGCVTVHPAVSTEPPTSVLSRLLEGLLAGAVGDNPVLARCARAPFEEPAAMAQALRAALLPLNRSAGKRALMRLCRRLQQIGAERIPAGPNLDGTLGAVEPRVVSAPDVAERACELGRKNATAAAEFQDSEPGRSRTPLLGSMEVELTCPWVSNGQTPPEPAAGQYGEETARLWQTPLVVQKTEDAESGESVSTSPDPDDITLRDAISVAELEPGLGQILPRRSDVGELVSNFSVSAPRSQGQLIEALLHSVEQHGTPLPPVVRRRARQPR